MLSEIPAVRESQSEIIAVHYENDHSDDVCKMINGSHISILYGAEISELRDFIDSCFVEYTHGTLLTSANENVQKLLDNHAPIIITLNAQVNETLPIMKGSYASIGPGNKGMMKPDATAPRTTIVSAKSYAVDGTPYSCKDVSDGCGLVFKEGTSMSTPNVAGGAALQRRPS